MRFIKLIIISFFLLFLLLMGISLFIPSHIRISRAINIGAPKQKVFEAMDDFKTWEHWNHFINNSQLTNKSISNPSFGKDAFVKSDQIIVSIFDLKNDSIKTDWDQINGKHFTGGFNFYQLRPDSITVQWYFDFHFKWYTLSKFTSLVYEDQLGPLMEGSLTDLKHWAENNP